jgi:hypothetical protein
VPCESVLRRRWEGPEVFHSGEAAIAVVLSVVGWFWSGVLLLVGGRAGAGAGASAMQARVATISSVS